jgi:hypothetical protein
MLVPDAKTRAKMDGVQATLTQIDTGERLNGGASHRLPGQRETEEIGVAKPANGKLGVFWSSLYRTRLQNALM